MTKRTQIKGIPPRVLLRQRDNATGSYPTILRTGDERTGNYGVSFNDRKTLIYDNPSTTGASSILAVPIADLSASSSFYSGGQDLIAQYRFEDNLIGARAAGASPDFSGTFTDGAFTSDTPFPHSRGAAVFNGTSTTFETTNSESFSFGDGTNDSPFSVVAWVRIGGNPGQSGEHARFPVCTKGGASSFEWNFWINTGSQLELELYDNSPAVAQRRVGTADIDGFSGEWVHVAATYDGRSGSIANTGISLYVNGEILSTTAANNQGSYAAMHETPGEFFIGFRGAGPQAFASGAIDEVGVFSKVLSGEEIRAICGYKDFAQRRTSWPTMLRGEHIHPFNNITSSLYGTVISRKGIGDEFISFTPGQNITPFNESFRPEQSATGEFFLTGTPETEIIPGFTSPLGSKTQLRYSFQIGSETQLNPTTASCHYFNLDQNKFELAGGDDGEPLSAGTSIFLLSEEARMFDAMGACVLSGVENLGAFTGLDNIAELLRLNAPSSALLTSSYAATGSQLLDMSGLIKHPFLLEKMTLEIPVRVGPGWMNDLTAYVEGASTGRDFGGPCVTFGLLRQESDTQREIILSATVIPEDDNKSIIYDPGIGSFTAPAGFLSYGNPTAVLSEAEVGTSQYTGSVFFNVQPVISNGMYVIEGLEMASVNGIGRRHTNVPSGRSLFGKEFTMPSLDKVEDEKKFSDDEVGRNGFRHDKHAVSPYILLPGDKLVLSIAKFRPVMTDPWSLGSQILTGSHDFFICTGTMNMTLYGSLIRETKEFQDTNNAPLTSLAVHEDIHGDNPIVDQFDIEASVVFSGSYIDHFMTGSIFGSAGAGAVPDTRRQVTKSIVGSTLEDRVKIVFTSSAVSSSYSIPMLVRAQKLVSNDERYFDTLLPRPDKMTRINGGKVYGDANTGINIFVFDEDDGASTADRIWRRSFPFEPKYRDVERTVAPFRDTLADEEHLTGNPSNQVSNNTSVSHIEYINGAAGTVSTHTFLLEDFTVTGRSSPDDIVARSLFGTGEGTSQVASLNAPVPIEFDTESGNFAYHRNVLIRGWKYGILSGLPINRSAYYRRDHFGHLRDRLEQGRDSKLYLDGGDIVPSPVQVRFTTIDGELSFSSNMSLEATSSLPYYDGESKNRGPLPDTGFAEP